MQVSHTTDLLERLSTSWSNAAKEEVTVEAIRGALIAECSELAAFRIVYDYYQGIPKVRKFYSPSRESFVVVLEIEESSMPKYPNIHVSTNIDGNAFAILGAVSQAMRRANVSQTEIEEFRKEATSGDYNHLLMTVMKWVDFS